jgi:hypothetical protein
MSKKKKKKSKEKIRGIITNLFCLVIYLFFSGYFVYEITSKKKNKINHKKTSEKNLEKIIS